jgi:hypothetical protein
VTVERWKGLWLVAALELVAELKSPSLLRTAMQTTKK